MGPTAAPTTAPPGADAGALAGIRAQWAQQPPVRSAPSLPKGTLPVLNDVCNVVVEGRQAGCACCPPELGPDCWSVPSEPDTVPRFVPAKVFWGAFTGAGKRSVYLADAASCVYNLGTYGAHIVAEQTAAGWRLVAQSPGTTLEQGLPWRLADGSDVMVALSRAGKTPWYLLEVQRFTPGSKSQPLVEWTNSAHGYCRVLSEGLGVASATLLGSAKVDRNGDGQADLVVRLNVRSGFVTRAILDWCGSVDAAQQHLPFEQQASPAAADRLPRRVMELVFHFDGSTFTPDQQKLDAFQAAMNPS